MNSKPFHFVVQKHDATQLHYDFRLEIGGVMPSWAIPKGPTLDNTKKRLAMETTDHDLEYRNFEGVLGPGYGEGPVMIWDEGTYIPEIETQHATKTNPAVREQIHAVDRGEEVMREGMEKGEIKFFLKGKKLHGSFALVKTRGFGPKNSWLLIKHNDEYVKKGYDANDYDVSARSGKSLAQIASEAEN